MKQKIEKIQPDDWHKAVLHECMMTESCYVESDPMQSVKNLIAWHVANERDALLEERKEQLVKNVFDSSDKKLMANHGFNDFIELLSAYEKLLAEREAMMKQEPLFYATKNLNIVITAETYNCGTTIGRADYPIPLYASPLPAQQIPEGYAARDSLDKFVESIGGYDSNAWHDYCADALYIKGFEAGRLSRMPVEPDSNIINAIKSVKIACGFNGHDEELYTNASTHEANKLYKAMLSASKKGDV